MDTIEENALTSSMLDDVFFIIKKCLRFVLFYLKVKIIPAKKIFFVSCNIKIFTNYSKSLKHSSFKLNIECV